MIVFGLTGGIGTGKTTAATRLSERGIPIVDSDIIARQLVEPGRPALSKIAELFGEEILDHAGALRRDVLAQRVFTDASARGQLEAVLHPLIRAAWVRQISDWRAGGVVRAAVVIPLLFETAVESHFDAVICTACQSATQRQRLAERGWDGQQISGRLAAQWPLEKKMQLARYVIWTEGPLAVLDAQLRRVLP